MSAISQVDVFDKHNYGFLANHDRARHLAACRAALDVAPDAPTAPTVQADDIEPVYLADPLARQRCPACHIGIMTVLRRYDRPFLTAAIPTVPLLAWNTS